MPTYTHLAAVAVTSGGVAHTKGSYAELTASTPSESSRLHVVIRNADTDQRKFLVDVATGGAGSETVVIPNVAYHVGDAGRKAATLSVDVDIAASTRIAVRCQCSTASNVVNVSAMHEDRSLASLGSVVCYGADTATSAGTAVVPNASASTKGSYAQITAATSAAHRRFALLITHLSTLFGNDLTCSLDIATGAAASEVVALPDVICGGVDVADGGDSPYPCVFEADVDVAASTRLAARCEYANGTPSLSERTMSIAVLAMDQV